jgi:hypothetical protein
MAWSIPGILLKSNFQNVRQTAVTSDAINVTISARNKLYRVFGAQLLLYVPPGATLGNSTP